MAAKLGFEIVKRAMLKELLKRGDDGIMLTLPKNDILELNTRITMDRLIRNGIDPDSLTSPDQVINILENINNQMLRNTKVLSGDDAAKFLNKAFPKKGEVIKADFGKPFAEEVVTVERVITDIKKLDPIEAMKETNKVLKGEGRYKSLSKADREKIAGDESVTDHIFERNIIDETEDFAQGGRTGLSYLLAEDTNERIGFGLGGFNAARRAFLKAMGAGAATVGAAKSGLFGLLKGGGKKQIAKELTQVPIKDIPGMPAWFKPLVNKVIKEGTEVNSGAERVIAHKTKLPNSKTDVYVNQDLDSGDVWVDIGAQKHGFADGHLGQPVRLEYKASEVIEPSYTKEGDYFKGHKTKEEFNVEEAEFTGGHPENVKFEESTIEKFGDHGSNFDEVEMFATGKVKKKTGKAKIKAEREHWVDDRAPEADDFASGGRAGYWIGGKVEKRRCW